MDKRRTLGGVAQPESGRAETAYERADRNLAELLQELRVALPGVQVVFGFLLTVPFTQRFERLNTFQRTLYFATLLCTALATALFVAPSANHRMLFRKRDKEYLLVIANRLTIAGLAAMALSMCGAILLISDVVFDALVPTISTAGAPPFSVCCGSSARYDGAGDSSTNVEGTWRSGRPPGGHRGAKARVATSYGQVVPILPVVFEAGAQGTWRIRASLAVLGEPLPAANALNVLEGTRAVPSDAVWAVSGVVSNERYVERQEHHELAVRSPKLGRPEATRAALILVRKSEEWWGLSQDERRAILEDRSSHIATGLKYVPAVARRLHHSRDLGEPFDFLTWFEFAPRDEAAFDELVATLRATEEWRFVDREVEIRLER